MLVLFLMDRYIQDENLKPPAQGLRAKKGAGKLKLGVF